MISINAYFLQSSALKNITALFGLTSGDQRTATTSSAVTPTISAAGGLRSIVSGQVGDALLAMKPTTKVDEDKSLPAGWSKYGSPGVRYYESLDDIEDPEVRAFFERSERLSRLYSDTKAEFGVDSIEYRTLSWRWESDRKAAFAEVAPVREQYGVDSIEYRNAVVLATKDWGVGDLAMAKRDYERAKGVLANPTHLRGVSYLNEKGQTRYVLDENGNNVFEEAPYTPEERAAAQKLVDDYQQTMAVMVKRVESSIRRAYGLTGQVMVQDKNGEYQWGAFRAYNEYTGKPAYTLSSDGIMTGYGNSGEVLGSNQLNRLWG